VLVIFLAGSCSTISQFEISQTHPQKHQLLFSAERVIQDEWQHVPMRGETEYRLTATDGKTAIRAIGRQSASALMRRVQVDPINCPQVSWSWHVDQLQDTAEIAVKEKEDVAASIFFLFGDPGLMISPALVPTLRYVWTSKQTPVETIVDSPYLPGVVKSIVVRSGINPSPWPVESRNILEDFIRAFGYTPREVIEAIALFTDNDQTKEPVTAYYEWARSSCKTDPQ